MSRGGPSFWDLNPAALDRAIALRNQALSCGAIGRALGCTRNVIIGKLSRMNLPSLFLGAHTSDGRRNFHDRPVKIKPEPKRNEARVGGNNNLSAARLPTNDERRLRPYTRRCKGKPITVLKDRECRFALGFDKQGQHIFCGAATEDKSSWCPSHRARVTKRSGEAE